jgi:hypothetical protein
MGVTAAVLLTGCASTGPAIDTAAPLAVPVSAPAMSGQATCALEARPMPSRGPSASFDRNDLAQRARRVLAEQHRPTPTRGVVPAAAVPGAEACVYFLRIQFSLLAAGSRAAPAEPAIEAALHSAGLTKIVIHPGPVFAASTGAACVHGSFTAEGPSFVIGPAATDGSCP